MNTVDLPDPARDAGGSGAALLHHFLRGPLARHGSALAIDVPPGRDRPQRQTLSYAELDALADRLARHIVARARPASPANHGEPIVALLIARTSPLLYAAQIAVLRAGAAFTCLDPAFPDERMREIIADAEPVLLLGDAAGVERLSALTSGLVLDADTLAQAAPPAVSLPADPAPSHLAYVIYTSGTTGKPKGVLIEHRNIANLVASDLVEFGLGPGDRVVQGSSAAYDSSLEEVWLALASGATLVVMDDAAARLGPDVVDWLKREAVTVFCPPPTLLRSSGCADPARALPDLRLLYVGGEALQQDLADLWAEGRRMVNGYGPTECAVTCLRCDVVPGQPVGIGRAVPGMTAWVLDDALNEVPEGEQGELCIGGAGVARGYRHRPDLVAEKFVDHPLLGRIYRTGDLVSRDETGTVFYHGRIDAQVKIRGYRVELGEIEARLAHCDGVRAAACRLQPAGAGQDLVGYVVPLDPASPPDADGLRAVLAETLPPYMVPVQIGLIDALPTSVSGKLDRTRLPVLAPQMAAAARELVAPEGELESLIAAAMADILRMNAVSVVDDFFADLGGDSLSAALLVTLLRDDTRTSWVTVSDIYEARSVRELAHRAHALCEAGFAEPAELAQPREGTVRPLLANVVQGGWLLAEIAGAGWIGWFSAFVVLPRLYARLGGAGLVLGAPLLAIGGLLLYIPATIALAVLLKRVLIGTYRPIRAPVWSAWYLRHWIVVQTVQLIPWPLLQGSELQQTILRWLGARIGHGVHIHRGVDLARGGWDLLDIGDHVAIGQDVQIGLADLDRGDVVIGPIVLEAGATMHTRSAIGGWCSIGAGAELTQLSVLNPGQAIPAGERWDGVPARRVGPAAPPPAATTENLPAWLWDLCAMAGEGLLATLAALPAQIMAVGLCWLSGLSAAAVWRWAWHPFPLGRAGLVVIAITVLSVPLTLVWSALLLRLMGKVRPGIHGRWSLGYLRAWLKSGALRVAGEWLTGTIFWSRWLRLAGMRVGPKCEISTIIDVVPELVTIGAETFFADGIYLGGGIVRHGTVELAPMQLGRNTFLGNHVVIPPGQVLPDDILIGIATVADDTRIASGQARFGHPDFDLPRREVVSVDRSLTHNPGPLRYANRALWEMARFALPVGPVLLTALWLMAVANAADRLPPALFGFVALPVLTALPPLTLCLGVLALKWALIGRVKPDQHPLWSCWCSRWDYVYVAWARWAAPVTRRLNGTFLLPVYLRAMGLKIGRRAVLGPQFVQVVDPDMIEIGDGATVSAMFQAHTFEDRVLKVDRVVIRAGATVSRGVVPLYGAAIDVNTHVGAGSVVMKREHLLPGLRYQGVPTRAIGEE